MRGCMYVCIHKFMYIYMYGFRAYMYIYTHIYTHTHRKVYRFRLYVCVFAFPSFPPFLVPATYTGISSIRDIGLQRRLRTHSVGRPAGVGPHLHSLGSRPQQSACFSGVSVCSCLTATHCNTLQHTATHSDPIFTASDLTPTICLLFKCVAVYAPRVCCSVIEYVAVWLSVLQCVASSQPRIPTPTNCLLF